MRSILLATSLTLSAAACTTVVATETGGDARFDASPPAAVISGDGGGCGDPDADAGNGHAWSDLYRDYFGPTGKASCAGTTGQCHGSADALGTKGSNYLCPGTAAACYQGMIPAGLISPGDTTSDPMTSTLYFTLRKACGLGGLMPKQPADLTFSPADMKRITDWIHEGAPQP